MDNPRAGALLVPTDTPIRQCELVHVQGGQCESKLAPNFREVVSDELGIDHHGDYGRLSATNLVQILLARTAAIPRRLVISDELGIDPHGTYHGDSKDVISDEHGTDPTRHVPRHRSNTARTTAILTCSLNVPRRFRLAA